MQNDSGEPEFALQLTKKLKGRYEESSKLPQPDLHENLFPGDYLQLYLNPILMYLVIFFCENALRDYKGAEGLETLLNKTPKNGNAIRVHFDPKVMDTPVFRGANGEDMLSGDSLQKDFRESQIRGGTAEPYGLHAVRSEFLTMVDTNPNYSDTQRLQTAGHRSNTIHQQSYAARNPGIDGQASLFGKKARQIDLAYQFRQFEIDWRPNLPQELPSAEFRKLREDEEYKKLASAVTDPELTDSRKVKRDLQKLEASGLKTKLSTTDLIDKRLPKKQLKKLEEGRLKTYWSNQPKPDTLDFESYSTVGVDLPFGRLRPVLPIRSQLADILVQPITMREPEGRKAIDLLIQLHQAVTEVHRSGLDANLCNCPRRKTKDNLHVYECVKNQHPFAEFCFSPCNEWVFSKEKWDQHCERHFHDGSLHKEVAWGKVERAFIPGYCPFCRWDETLSPGERLRAFPTEKGWREHISGHDLSNHCHDPRCNEPFESEIDFQDHMKDVHRVPTELLARDDVAGGYKSTNGGHKRKLQIAFEYFQAPETEKKAKVESSPPGTKGSFFEQGGWAGHPYTEP
ncbi:unnamed protein product [Clonostachys rosea f. rosea IK726]|uniref:Uncharacterized protein n=1 Tax=Clonostachys rosea f. rosea IK726 TaxID=1349383 RepID=A0ACA9TEL9_BIOOC|nr:unnamed protein product [Clonostachys rosea f. rosea IK726]